MKYALLIILVSLSSLAKTAEKKAALANFRAGTYSLEKGEADLCGEGEFYLRQNGSNVAFGDLHGFDTVPKSEAVPGDAPGDEKCMYLTENEIEVKGPATEIRFKEERKCGKAIKHTLTSVALIRKEMIKLDVKQTGEEAQSYSCTWKFKKAPAKN